jgi:hypothetical protein
VRLAELAQQREQVVVGASYHDVFPLHHFGVGTLAQPLHPALQSNRARMRKGSDHIEHDEYNSKLVRENLTRPRNVKALL